MWLVKVSLAIFALIVNSLPSNNLLTTWVTLILCHETIIITIPYHVKLLAGSNTDGQTLDDQRVRPDPQMQKRGPLMGSRLLSHHPMCDVQPLQHLSSHNDPVPAWTGCLHIWNPVSTGL